MRPRFAALALLGLTAGCSGSGEEPGEHSSSSSSSCGDSMLTSTGAEPALTTTDVSAAESSTSDTDEGSCGDDPSWLGCPTDDSCSLWNNDCPAGQKCNLSSNEDDGHWTTSKCVPLDPDPSDTAEACTVQDNPSSGLDNCGVSAVCLVQDSEALEGYCQPLCVGSESDPTCEDPARNCVFSTSGPGLCIRHCDPLDPDTCPTGEGCYPETHLPQCLPDVSEPNRGAAFETCGVSNSCDPGQLCANASSIGACQDGDERCCTPWCDLAAPACPDPTTCLPVYIEGAAPVGFETVGFCGQEAP